MIEGLGYFEAIIIIGVVSIVSFMIWLLFNGDKLEGDEMKKKLTLGQEARNHICNFNAETKARKVLSEMYKEEYDELVEKYFEELIEEWNSSSYSAEVEDDVKGQNNE